MAPSNSVSFSCDIFLFNLSSLTLLHKKEDEIYCPECGKPIKRNAVIYIYCGVQVRELKGSNKKEDKRVEVSAKNKTTAIMLSVFFSYWSWLYTYKKNYKKFWLGFGIVSSIITIIVLLIIIFNSELFIAYGTWIWLLWLILQVGTLCSTKTHGSGHNPLGATEV